MVFYSVKDRNSDIRPMSGVRRSMSRALEPGNTPPLLIHPDIVSRKRTVCRLRFRTESGRSAKGNILLPGSKVCRYDK